MKNGYLISYLKIYLWQGIAFLLRFVSMFIVTPFLTKDPSTFGVYSVCLSVTMFLNYADLGFLNACQKYASECFARKEDDLERKYIGFGTFVLLVFSILFSIVFIFLSFNPHMLIKGLENEAQIRIARKLLFILAIFTPVTVFQRMISMVFEIRLNNYVTQRISLISSIVTIGSVFIFFTKNKYDIVGYYLFGQIMISLSVIVNLFLARKRYHYDIKGLLRSIRFDPMIFKKANALAFSGLYCTIFWILFYELDQIAIGKYLGAEKVAAYAIAFSFSTIFRFTFSILYSPFTNRVNYFIGNKDDEGLKSFCMQLSVLTAPLVLIPTVAFVVIAKPFILSWVGDTFAESIPLARFYATIFMFGFISYPASMILTAKVRIKESNFISTIQPFIYWAGILITYHTLGLMSFALFKFIARYISELFCLYILINFIGVSLTGFIKKVFYPVLLPMIFMVVSLMLLEKYLPGEKSKVNLAVVVGTTGSVIAIALVIQYFISNEIKMMVGNVFSMYRKK